MILLRRLILVTVALVATGVFLAEKFNRNQIREKVRVQQNLFLLQTVDLIINENRKNPEINELEPARAEKLLRLWKNSWEQFTGAWHLSISTGRNLLFDSEDLIINRLLKENSLAHKQLFDAEASYRENNLRNRALKEQDPAYFQKYLRKPFADYQIASYLDTTEIKTPLVIKEGASGVRSVNGFITLKGTITESPLPSLAFSLYLAALMTLSFFFYRINRKRELRQMLRSSLKFSALIFVLSAMFLTYRVSRIYENERAFAQTTTAYVAADNFVADKNLYKESSDFLLLNAFTDAGKLTPAFSEKIRTGYSLASLVFILLISGVQIGLLYGYLSGKIQKTIDKFGFAYAGVAPAALATLIIIFLPFFYSIILSFSRKMYGEFYFSGFDNYYRILADFAFMPRSFYYTLAVTILWTGVNIIFHTSIGLALAMLLKSESLRGKGIYRALLILPWAVPSYITALVWKGMFHRQFGIINHALAHLGVEPISWFSSFPTAFFANALTNTWLGFPFMMVIAIGALQSIPKDLYEAADMDGASRWQKFRLITAPLLKPAMYPSIILGIVWTFNMFNIIYLVSNGAPNNKTDILIVEAYRYAFENDAYSTASAYSMIIFFILLGYSRLTNRKNPGEN